jgi:tryptophan-rich sensory protein
VVAYFVAGAVAVVAAMLGGIATDIGPWYYALRKPTWQPPDWLFAPAWTLIFGLCAWSGGAAWHAADPTTRIAAVVAPFAVNLIFNVAWSFLFFRARRPDWALYEVLGLWLSTLALVLAIWQVSVLAGLLLLPYLAWVSFATCLNWTIVRLNRPFT